VIHLFTNAVRKHSDQVYRLELGSSCQRDSCRPNPVRGNSRLASNDMIGEKGAVIP
jgi:hypothetical protein